MARPRSRVGDVKVAGPLAPFVAAYTVELRERGYRPSTAVNKLRQVARLSRWLEASCLTAADLSSERVEQFLGAERAAGHRPTRPGLACLVDVLGGLGMFDAELPVAQASSPTDVLLERFRVYLVEERGLVSCTADAYVACARRFVDGLSCRRPRRSTT